MSGRRPILQRAFFAFLLAAIAAPSVPAAESGAEAIPTAEAIAEMVQKEPFSRATWPTWRKRHLDWFYDRTKKTEKFYEQIQAFVRQEAEASRQTLPDYLAGDAVAWHVYGRALMHEKKPASPADSLARAEVAFRRSIALDAKFAPPHGGVAGVLIMRTLKSAGPVPEKEAKQPLLQQAEKEIQTYASLDSRSRPAFLRGFLAFAQEDYTKAEASFRQALQDYPENEGAAMWLAQTVLAQQQRSGKWSEATAPLVKRFPEEGQLHVYHALALMRDGEAQAAAEQLQQARQAKVKPEQSLPPETVKAIEDAAKLMTPNFVKGCDEFKAKRYAAAERFFREAVRERPDECEYARALAHAVLLQNLPDPAKTEREVKGLCERFPQDGELQTLRAMALARADRLREAGAALDKAQQLGVDPATIIGAQSVDKIRELSRPGLVARFLWGMAYFAAAYAGIIALMAFTGVVLAAFTRGQPASLASPFVDPHELYRNESWLARFYMLALILSLVLFYVSIPFVVVGLVGMTAAAVYGIFLLRRIPVKLVILIVVVGIGMAIAVLKSLFARAATKGLGIEKKPSDCPRFHEALREVAQKVETTPVDEVCLAPGAEISVHQQGRGPFGVFGVKQRVLTVGLAVLRYLTVGELKAILAHEYAHFSHRDTFYSRFIHQVTMSIDSALSGMASAGGKLNYVNPFFWFFVLYYRAYNLLAAGFSRSREYLADRMAASLYGKDVFLTALTKVATDGTLFESTVYQNIHHLLSEGKAFVNVYDAFSSYRDEQLSDEERLKTYEEILNQKGSVFSSHPTIRERVAAVAAFPQAAHPDQAPALSLFDNVEELEKELTELLTGVLHTVYVWQPQAAQAQEGE